jgi:pyridoxine 4-dehydrogenase
MAFIPWAPLGSAGRDAPPDTGARAALESAAQKHGISLQKAQLVWLLSRSKALVPIPGTSKVEHLEDNVSAAALRFTPAEMKRIG